MDAVNKELQFALDKLQETKTGLHYKNGKCRCEVRYKSRIVACGEWKRNDYQVRKNLQVTWIPYENQEYIGENDDFQAFAIKLTFNLDSNEIVASLPRYTW